MFLAKKGAGFSCSIGWLKPECALMWTFQQAWPLFAGSAYIGLHDQPSIVLDIFKALYTFLCLGKCDQCVGGQGSSTP